MEVLKKEKQLKDVVVEHYYTCDKCSERISKYVNDAFEFELEYKTGKSWHDYADITIQKLDLCQSCSKDAIELLKNNGYKVQSKDIEF